MIRREDTPFKQDIEVIRYFREQFRTVSNSLILDLLERFETKPFMNAEVRAIFGSKRQTTWAKRCYTKSNPVWLPSRKLMTEYANSIRINDREELPTSPQLELYARGMPGIRQLRKPIL